MTEKARCREILRQLKSLGNGEGIAGMARYGIRPARPLGVGVTTIRWLAGPIGTDHDLAAELWATGIHEARILATLVDEPAVVGRRQMDAWAADFDSWDLCDLACNNLFVFTPHAWDKVRQWTGRSGEFVKRAGFALLACLCVHDKAAGDEEFAAMLPVIRGQAGDERKYVKKAVNWALRQIGKRSRALNRAAVREARAIRGQDSRAARWIAADALRELTSEKTQGRLPR